MSMLKARATSPRITSRGGERGGLVWFLPVIQSQPFFGCQVFSSLTSVKNLPGISAPGQHNHWPPLGAKHQVIGDVTLQRMARQRGDSCTYRP